MGTPEKSHKVKLHGITAMSSFVSGFHLPWSGIPHRPEPKRGKCFGTGARVKPIVGLLSNDIAAMDKASMALTRTFGRTDLESGTLDFTHSDYYRKEMGSGLKRRFLSFQRLLSLKDIYKMKLKTNRLEEKFLKDGKRRVNIDPGYLDHAKLVLFSTKDYTHRIYLNKGIYAEVTLFYKDGRFNAWPWTYPDYRSDGYIGIFNSIRKLYADNL